MHGNNDSKGWVTSKKYERYSGSNPVMLEERAKQERTSNKPDTKVDGCISTGAGSSQGNNK